MNKSMEGKTVYLLGTGNNARRNHNNTEVAQVKAVAKVYVTLLFGRHERKFRFKGMHLSSDDNTGWLAFESRQELDSHLESLRLSHEISERCRYQRDLMGVSLENLRKINELLGGEQ